MDQTGELDLRTERIRLRTAVESDRQALVTIRSTPEVRRWWRGDDLGVEFDESLADDELDVLTIETIDGRIIGMIQFEQGDDPDYRHASIDLYLDPAVHRRGYGAEAIDVLVRHLTDDRGHHRFVIDPAVANVAAIRCYTSVGFNAVGVMHQYERRSDGTWGDGLLMELLASELSQRDI